MSWVEYRLASGAKVLPLYHAADRAGALSYHHFYGEPWHPHGAVVRIKFRPGTTLKHFQRLEALPGVESHVPWSDAPDAELFGEHWEWTQRFFNASAALAACGPDHNTTVKLVHCLLNARNMGAWGEAWFALRFAWNRLTMPFRWHLYLRRRWERAQAQ